MIPGQDLERLGVGSPLKLLDDPLHVGQLEEGLERLDGVGLERAVAEILALDSGAVAEHDARDVGGGPGHVDRPAIAGADQAGQAADVVIVGVRDDHRVEPAWVEREIAIGAQWVDPIGVEQSAIEQNLVRADFQEVGAARDLPCGAMERNSQPSILRPRGLTQAAPPLDFSPGRAGAGQLARGTNSPESRFSAFFLHSSCCHVSTTLTRASARFDRMGCARGFWWCQVFTPHHGPPPRGGREPDASGFPSFLVPSPFVAEG